MELSLIKIQVYKITGNQTKQNNDKNPPETGKIINTYTVFVCVYLTDSLTMKLMF